MAEVHTTNNQDIESNTDSIAKRKFPEEDEERDFDFGWDEEDE